MEAVASDVKGLLACLSWLQTRNCSVRMIKKNNKSKSRSLIQFRFVGIFKLIDLWEIVLIDFRIGNRREFGEKNWTRSGRLDAGRENFLFFAIFHLRTFLHALERARYSIFSRLIFWLIYWNFIDEFIGSLRVINRQLPLFDYSIALTVFFFIFFWREHVIHESLKLHIQSSLNWNKFMMRFVEKMFRNISSCVWKLPTKEYLKVVIGNGN